MKMEKNITVDMACENDEEKLSQMYLKVVIEPNQSYLKKECIKCPECGEEILMIRSLKMMNEAIENHVNIHKKLPHDNSIEMRCKSINMRLDLAQQVLKQASRVA